MDVVCNFSLPASTLVVIEFTMCIVVFQSYTRQKSITGTHAPIWIKDPQANRCMQCDEKFTAIKRRHHCRACGIVSCVSYFSLCQKLQHVSGVLNRRYINVLVSTFLHVRNYAYVMMFCLVVSVLMATDKQSGTLWTPSIFASVILGGQPCFWETS